MMGSVVDDFELDLPMVPAVSKEYEWVWQCYMRLWQLLMLAGLPASTTTHASNPRLDSAS